MLASFIMPLFVYPTSGNNLFSFGLAERPLYPFFKSFVMAKCISLKLYVGPCLRACRYRRLAPASSIATFRALLCVVVDCLASTRCGAELSLIKRFEYSRVRRRALLYYFYDITLYWVSLFIVLGSFIGLCLFTKGCKIKNITEGI